MITLTTDFGTRDWFVGTMKGVILGIQPRATVVDITHEIPSGDIRAGAFTLMASCRFFPKGTIHVAVIDPGVGGARKAIAVQTANFIFTGPDNGVLSWALAGEKIKAIHAIENEAYCLRPVSQTFHGRDVFAPVAAHLDRGVPLHKLGPKLKGLVRLAWPEPSVRRNVVQGEVVYVDCFGNAITNLTRSWVKSDDDVVIKGRHRCRVRPFYQSAPAGQTVAVMGSSGYLEIAVNGGSAARKFRLKIGDVVSVPNSLTEP